MSIVKNAQGEINFSPVPVGIQQHLRKYGMWICSFYSGVANLPRQLKPRRFNHYVISHMIEGKGRFWTSGMKEPQKISPGSGVIVYPDLLQFYGGDGDCYVEDSIGFAGPVVDGVFN